MDVRPNVRGLFALVGFLAVIAAHRPANAWDWRGAPVDFRIALAFDRAWSTYTDVVGLSASAAYPYGSSVNPANDDFIRVAPNDFAVAGTATGFFIPFSGGALIAAQAGSVSGRIPGAGTLTATYSHTQSYDARSAQGDTFTLRSQDVTVGYSQAVTQWLALGGEFRITDSNLRFGSSIMDFPLDTETGSTAYDFRVGGLMAIGKHWLVALMAGAGWSYGHTRGSLEIPEDFGGPAPVGFHTLTRSVNLRAGAGWRPSDRFGAYVDWEFLHLWTDDDSLSVGRGFAGIEYQPIPALALRLGGSVDTAAKTNVSVGVGFYGLKHVQIELAYVYNAFPEVSREFGRAHLVSVSIAIYY